MRMKKKQNYTRKTTDDQQIFGVSSPDINEQIV